MIKGLVSLLILFSFMVGPAYANDHKDEKNGPHAQALLVFQIFHNFSISIIDKGYFLGFQVPRATDGIYASRSFGGKAMVFSWAIAREW